VSGVEKLEFGSGAWVDHLAAVLREALRGLDVDEGVSISEEYTSPPAHLLRPGSTTIGWHLTLTRDGVDVTWGPLSEATSRSVTDYRVAHRLATADPSSAEEVAELEAFVATAIREGHLHKAGGVAERYPALKEALNGVHDAVLARTR
jgi:hypothetical protein